ncbi:MAG: ABC transporter substrate-binding protein [Chloroflexota bacterium]
MRGFRWQVLVLVMALILFGISLASRMGDNNNPQTTVPTATLSATATNPPTVAPTDAPVVLTPNNNGINAAANIPTYKEALIGNVQRLNPLLASLNPVDRDITSLIFEGLVKINAYGEPIPSLAKSWVISSDGLDYVFQLRSDVLWQDGIPFGAADVLYTISILQASDFPGDPALGAFWRTIEVQQLDTQQIRFRLTQPLGSFLDAMQIGILPEHALRGTNAAHLASHPFNLSPIGTGPYQLEALRSTSPNRTDIVDLRVAPVYKQRPEGQTGYTVDRISFQLYGTFDEAMGALKNGNVDGLAGRDREESAALLDLSNVSLHTTVEPTLGVLIFNWASDKTKFFREQRIRQALQIGLNRNSLVSQNLITASMKNEAVTANSPMIPGSWAYINDLAWPSPDLTAAAQLLDTSNLGKGAAGGAEATPDPSGKRFSFNILVPNVPNLVKMAQDIAKQWGQLNIDVTVEAVDQDAYQKRLDSDDFGAAIVELSMKGSADPDVYEFWDADQYPDGKNYGGVDDRHIAEDLERARGDFSGINRAIRYKNFQEDFASRAIAIPLYYPLYTYAVAGKVAGVQLGFMGSPASRFVNLQNWTLSP